MFLRKHGNYRNTAALQAEYYSNRIYKSHIVLQQLEKCFLCTSNATKNERIKKKSNNMV